jgi:hypothetical protein
MNMVFAYGGAMIVRSFLRMLDDYGTHLWPVPGATCGNASPVGFLEGDDLCSDLDLYRILALRYVSRSRARNHESQH